MTFMLMDVIRVHLVVFDLQTTRVGLSLLTLM
jgi:hypothetical protein